MFCPYCGEKIEKSYTYCAQCGAAVKNIAEALPDNVPVNTPDTPNVKVNVEASGVEVNTCGTDQKDNHAQNFTSDNNASSGTTYNVEVNYNAGPNQGFNNGRYIQKRSIVLAICYTFLTCGLYGIYWIWQINDETNSISGNVHATSGGVVVLLSIITCGLYSLYWHLVMGNRLDDTCKIYGLPVNGRGIAYLLLDLFALGIVSMCLEQHTLNKLIDATAPIDV